MSKITLVVTGLVLAVVGFGLGHYVGSSPDSRETRASPVSPKPLEPLKSSDTLVDVLKDPDDFSKVARLGTLLLTLGPEAVPEVEQALRTRKVKRGLVELVLLTRFWAMHDPEAAAQWAVTGVPRAYRIATTQYTIEYWASRDPEAALQYVVSLGAGGGEEASVAQKALVRGWYDSGRPGLMEFMRDLGMGFGQQVALSEFSMKMIQRDGVDALTKWAEELPEDPIHFKLAAYRRVATEITKADPAAGVAWCAKHCRTKLGGNMRERVAAAWAIQDGPATMKWLSTSPEGPGRDHAVQAAFRLWKWEDPMGLELWMQSIGRENFKPWLQPALVMYAKWLARRERPLEALKWAELIENERERRGALVTIAREWRDVDEAAAEAWLERSPLSEKERKRARKPLPKKNLRGKQARPLPIDLEETLEDQEAEEGGESQDLVGSEPPLE